LLRTSPPAPAPMVQPPAPAPVQVAYAPPVRGPQAAARPRPSKVWLQLASGPNAEALPTQFKRMKSRNSDLFDGIKGYVARSPDRARLVIGPFRSAADAEIFAEDLGSVNVNAFKWTNTAADTIVPLGTE